jgi:phosphoribosylaminoimidazole carboxylase PurE protein
VRSTRTFGTGAEAELDATEEHGVITPAAQSELAELPVDNGPIVGVVMGSKSDRDVMQGACDELDSRSIKFEVRVMSAHREPDDVCEYARNAQIRGLKLIIAGAGMAAALPGMIASNTDLPVIGVPIRSADGVGDGLDALLSIAQSPPGVPVACVAVNGAKNAAILASRILYS